MNFKLPFPKSLRLSSSVIEDGAVGIKLKNGETVISAVDAELLSTVAMISEGQDFVYRPFMLIMAQEGMALIPWIPLTKEEWEKPVACSLDISVLFRLPPQILQNYLQQAGLATVLKPSKQIIVP